MIKRVKNVFVNSNKASDLSSFYTEVFGAPEFEDGERWTQYRLGGLAVAIAGEEQAPNGAGGQWIPSFEVDNLEETLSATKTAGGSVDALNDLGDHGRSVFVRDPGGNVFILWVAS